MIEIDPESKKIFFYYSPEEIKHNPKRDDTMHEFELLSGYVCPECKKVLDAYYIGELKIGSSSNEYYSHPYFPSNSYDKHYPHYKYGHNYGGGYLGMYNHNDTFCKTYIASTGGIIEGIKSIINLITPKPQMMPTDSMIRNFASSIFEKKIQGVSFIEDVCKKREPILTVDKKIFTQHIKWEGHTDFDKNYIWETVFYKLVIKDEDVQIIGEN